MCVSTGTGSVWITWRQRDFRQRFFQLEEAIASLPEAYADILVFFKIGPSMAEEIVGESVGLPLRSRRPVAVQEFLRAVERRAHFRNGEIPLQILPGILELLLDACLPLRLQLRDIILGEDFMALLVVSGLATKYGPSSPGNGAIDVVFLGACS